MTKKLKQAGCWMIGYGIKSENQEILNRTNKGITLDQSRRACKLTKQAGIEIIAHCMVGLLVGSVGTVKQTYKFVKELDPDFAQFYCVVPMSWTNIYKEAKGWIKSEDYHFYEQNFSVMRTGNMTIEEVMKWGVNIQKILSKANCGI